MKSAYELAMERLNKTAPIKKINEDQKKEINEIDSKYSARIAEREIFLKSEMTKAMAQGDYAKLEDLEKQLVNERKALQAEMEEKKEAVRQAKK